MTSYYIEYRTWRFLDVRLTWISSSLPLHECDVSQLWKTRGNKDNKFNARWRSMCPNTFERALSEQGIYQWTRSAWKNFHPLQFMPDFRKFLNKSNLNFAKNNQFSEYCLS